MDYKRIEQLLDKYWECETSIEEENELKEFFTQEDVPEQWKETALLFRYYKSEIKNRKLDKSFDSKVIQNISNPQIQGKEGKVIQWYNRYARVAAVVLILVAVSFVITRTLQKQQQKALVADTYQNPEDAFAETKKALLLISKNIGKGKDQAMKLTKFNKAEEKIKNNESNL